MTGERFRKIMDEPQSTIIHLDGERAAGDQDTQADISYLFGQGVEAGVTSR